MLELKKIKKDYSAGDNTVHALKGIDLTFRNAEFVSILGPSGCGKTTMLNIIGGLDKYNSGDLFINGRSTKSFKDRDWDTYRNHSIGFVFQSYNLIPHQSVLQNVELALTLSGVSKSERRARAKKALIDVGLDGQFKKLPSEMSGGQMQRVAIARALVNNPDIILADEPTGALDTETSVQVMDILKEISKNKLVIMVTHNPDLANKYSTRIINMLDGEITGDSNPLTDEDIKEQKQLAKVRLEEESKMKKPSMSFFTSFGLSLKNLFTKKGRTVLTSFAGSIGIIGIALILAVSQGTTTFINDVQEDTLTAYPLTLEASTIEMSSLINAFMDLANEDNSHEFDAVYKKAALYDMINAVNNIQETKNDLKAFKTFLEEQLKKDEEFDKAVNGVQYSYDLDLQIYTETVDGVILRSDLEEILNNLILKYMKIDMSAMSNMSPMGSMSSFSSMGTMNKTLWQELLPAKDGSPVNPLLKDQYEVTYGDWPKEYNEIVLVLDKNNELDDVTLYSLGLLSADDIDNLANAALNGAALNEKETVKWSYEDICNRTYKAVLNADCFNYDENTGLYSDLRATEAGVRYLYNNAIPLKVTGIIKPREDADTTMLKGSICYTNALTKYLIEKSESSPIVNAQLSNPNTDVITGLPFDSSTGNLSDAEKEQLFREYISQLDTASKAAKFIEISSIPPEEFLSQQIAATLSTLTRADIEKAITQAMSMNMGVTEEKIAESLSVMSDEELNGYFTLMLTEQLKAKYASETAAKLSTMSPEELATALDMSLASYTTEMCAKFYDETMKFSESTYENNLISMGYMDLNSPSAINLYASSFENKDLIVEFIDKYNKSTDELKKISYTDYLGIMMSSITTIIDAITYVLIAFVAISLIVSSIMIGVITLISVQERTKEIGILRAIGASKKDVSGLFNAETVIVGFTSGLLGIVVTYLLCIPINIILNHLTGIANLKAILPINAAIILILISVCLTLISGIIPSRSAAKKDPVVALRTE